MRSTEGPWTLSIPNGGTDSPALSSLLSSGAMALLVAGARRLNVLAPAALTAAVTVQGTNTVGGSDWSTMQDRGADVAVGAGKLAACDFEGIKDIRIHSAGAEAAQRDFIVTVQVEL